MFPVKPHSVILNQDYFQEFIMIFKRRMSSNQHDSCKKYDTISLDNRKTLVRLVVDEERSISKSARKLGIKLSTAKLIIKKYKQSGTFFEKKSDKMGREQTLLKVQEQNRSELQGDGNNALPVDELSPSQATFSTEVAQSYPYVCINEPQIYVYNYYPTQMYWM